jgi:hypothetical protein
MCEFPYEPTYVLDIIDRKIAYGSTKILDRTTLPFFLSYFYIFLVKRIYCSLPSEQYLECSCIAVYKCILLHNSFCIDMQISCSALNAAADSTDGEQQKMEEPTSTRVADKVPAICPLTSPFSISF